MKGYLLKQFLGKVNGFEEKYISHHQNLNQYFFDSLDKALDVYCSYEKVVLVGDFNGNIGKHVLTTSISPWTGKYK